MFQIKKSKVKTQKLEWEDAAEVKKDIREILKVLDFPHINPSRIFCYKSYGSKSRSYARIWTFPKIFQRALLVKPAYVIEVLAKHYDNLDSDNKKKVLIHELLHIPKNFSGALVPHKGRNRSLGKTADLLFDQYKSSTFFSRSIDSREKKHYDINPRGKPRDSQKVLDKKAKI